MLFMKNQYVKRCFQTGKIKKVKKHWIFLKPTFKISLFLTKKIREPTAAFDFYNYG